MKSLGVFFLVGVLTLWMAPPSRSGTILPVQKIPRGKPDTCPYVIFKCAMYNPPDRCQSDRQCPRFKKCCETFCGKDCVYPKGYGKA
ncbi:caltrin-like protein 2 isoform X5 [Eretmochelys imbricata]